MTNKKTPAQELGYKVGDVFTLKKGSEIGKDYSSNLMNAASSRIVLEEDDGSSCIKFYLEGHSEISGYVALKAVKKTLPKAINPKFKEGDVVIVTSNRRTYSTYEDAAESVASKYYEGSIETFNDGSLGVIVGTPIAGVYETIYGVLSYGRFSVIDEAGLVLAAINKDAARHYSGMAKFHIGNNLTKGSFEEAVDHFIENTEGTEAFVSTELNKIVVYFDGMEFIGNKDRAIEVMKALLVLFPKQ